MDTRLPPELANDMDPCPFCKGNRDESCAECGSRSAPPAMPEAPLGFRWEDALQRWRDALYEDMRRPCPEDKP